MPEFVFSETWRIVANTPLLSKCPEVGNKNDESSLGQNISREIGRKESVQPGGQKGKKEHD